MTFFGGNFSGGCAFWLAHSPTYLFLKLIFHYITDKYLSRGYLVLHRRFNINEQPLCEGVRRVIFPKQALNLRNEWKYGRSPASHHITPLDRTVGLLTTGNNLNTYFLKVIIIQLIPNTSIVNILWLELPLSCDGKFIVTRSVQSTVPTAVTFL